MSEINWKYRAESAEVILRSANERLALANAKLAAVQNAMVEMRCCAVEASDSRATFVWNQAAGMIQAALLTEEASK